MMLSREFVLEKGAGAGNEARSTQLLEAGEMRKLGEASRSGQWHSRKPRYRTMVSRKWLFSRNKRFAGAKHAYPVPLQNTYMGYLDYRKKTIKDLGISPSTCSFNPGVIVANMTEWKHQRITKQLEKWMQKNVEYVWTLGTRVLHAWEQNYSINFLCIAQGLEIFHRYLRSDFLTEALLGKRTQWTKKKIFSQRIHQRKRSPMKSFIIQTFCKKLFNIGILYPLPEFQWTFSTENHLC